MNSRAGSLMTLLLISSLLLTCRHLDVLGAEPAVPEASAKLQYLIDRFDGVRIQPTKRQDADYKLRTKQLMEFNNPISGAEGAVFVWTDDARPMVVSKCHVNDIKRYYIQSSTSVAPEPFVMQRGAQVIWTCPEPGDVISKWKPALDAASGSVRATADIAMWIVAQDRLFDGEAFRESEAELFLSRISLLPRGAITTWGAAAGESEFFAVLSLIHLDQLFVGGTFDQQIFQKALQALSDVRGGKSELPSRSPAELLVESQPIQPKTIPRSGATPNENGETTLKIPLVYPVVWQKPASSEGGVLGALFNAGGLPDREFQALSRRQTRNQTLLKEHLRLWKVALESQQAFVESQSLLINLALHDGLYLDDMLQPEKSNKYIARIADLTARMIEQWQTALAQSRIEAVWCIIQLDPIFESPRGDREAAADELMNRLKSIDRKIIRQWTQVAGVDELPAKLFLIQQEPLFDGKMFQISYFEKLLTVAGNSSSVRETSAPAKSRKVTGAKNPLVDRIFSVDDRDRDGLITRAEAGPPLRRDFDNMDADQSGTIDRDELTSFFSRAPSGAFPPPR